jgi:glycolate oxidase FAD binding subunit
VSQACASLGGERVDERGAEVLWQEPREQRDNWFAGDLPLWRIALPSTAPPLALAGQQCMEWGGALRWLRCDLPAGVLRECAARRGGHATLFRGGDRSRGVFTPLAPPVMAIHQRLKDEFDPARIFNPGRMYAEL